MLLHACCQAACMSRASQVPARWCIPDAPPPLHASPRPSPYHRRCVFYYSGAASRAGLSYSGAILASKDGQWPTSQVCGRDHAGFQARGATSGCSTLPTAQGFARRHTVFLHGWSPPVHELRTCSRPAAAALHATCAAHVHPFTSAAITVQEAQQRIEATLQSAGIRPWELSSVDNSNCVDAPLDPSLMAMA